MDGPDGVMVPHPGVELQADDAILGERAGRMSGRVEHRERRRVERDRDLVRRHPPPHEPLAERVVHGQGGAGEPDGEAFLEQQHGEREASARGGEAAPEELRHCLVEVEDDGHARQPQRQGREHEEVGDRFVILAEVADHPHQMHAHHVPAERRRRWASVSRHRAAAAKATYSPR